MGILLCWAGCLQAVEPHVLRSMVIVSGDQGRGSGFIVKMNDGIYVVTNSHVIRGNKNIIFKTLDNKALSTGLFEIADNADLVRASLPGASDALEILPNAQEHVKVRDSINVIGNSEGQGVVREIGGKVLGIGPDRIEVDAAFVAGNSGSPILWGKEDQIVGVATFVTIPRLPSETPSDSPKSKDKKGKDDPTRLNEVRRFGYRLDTVGKWLHPQPWNRILKEGEKLAEMEELSSLLINIVSVKPTDLAKTGSTGLLDEAKIAGRPVFAALAKALDTLSKVTNAHKGKNKTPTGFEVTNMLEAVRVATAADLRGFDESQFTGFHASVFREQLGLRKELFAWLNSVLSEKGAKPDEFDNPLARKVGSPTGGSSHGLQIQLEDKLDPSAPPANQHQIICQAGTKPRSLESLFWIVVDPISQNHAYQMGDDALPLATPKAGTYRVWVEYRPTGAPRVVSNVVEIKVPETPPTSAPTPSVPPSMPTTAITAVRPSTSASSDSLPAPWRHQDIGNVKAKGTATVSGDTFVVQGAGDIDGKADSCHFAWRTLHGDGELVARATPFENPANATYAKVAVCLRESLDAGSRMVTFCTTQAAGTFFIHRDTTHNRTSTSRSDPHDRVPKGQFPCWLKLARHGDQISGYESADGETWHLTNQTNMSLPVDVSIGLIATSHEKDVLLKATFDHVKMSEADKSPSTSTLSGQAPQLANLLSNPRFENGMNEWTVHSWNSIGNAALDPREPYEGKPSLRLDNPGMTDTWTSQKVHVKPNTRYRMTAMVKTKDIHPENPQSKLGANLSVVGGYELSPDLQDSSDWKKVTFEINSKDRSELEVGARIGYNNTRVTGTAWFADLKLEEHGADKK